MLVHRLEQAVFVHDGSATVGCCGIAAQDELPGNRLDVGQVDRRREFGKPARNNAATRTTEFGPLRIPGTDELQNSLFTNGSDISRLQRCFAGNGRLRDLGGSRSIELSGVVGFHVDCRLAQRNRLWRSCLQKAAPNGSCKLLKAIKSGRIGRAANRSQLSHLVAGRSSQRPFNGGQRCRHGCITVDSECQPRASFDQHEAQQAPDTPAQSSASPGSAPARFEMVATLVLRDCSYGSIFVAHLSGKC